MYFESNKIRVFPSSNRDDKYDRNARLNTEHNLISLVNRLTKFQSFVIKGLSVDNEDNCIYAGSCNIYGYYFELDKIDLSNINNKYIYLQIQLSSLSINTEDSNVYTTIKQLDGDDISETGSYNGLSIVSSDKLPQQDSADIKYLILAYKDKGE
jgi:hypothetical protein